MVFKLFIVLAFIGQQILRAQSATTDRAMSSTPMMIEMVALDQPPPPPYEMPKESDMTQEEFYDYLRPQIQDFIDVHGEHILECEYQKYQMYNTDDSLEVPKEDTTTPPKMMYKMFVMDPKCEETLATFSKWMLASKDNDSTVTMTIMAMPTLYSEPDTSDETPVIMAMPIMFSEPDTTDETAEPIAMQIMYSEPDTTDETAEPMAVPMLYEGGRDESTEDGTILMNTAETDEGEVQIMALPTLYNTDSAAPNDEPMDVSASSISEVNSTAPEIYNTYQGSSDDSEQEVVIAANPTMTLTNVDSTTNTTQNTDSSESGSTMATGSNPTSTTKTTASSTSSTTTKSTTTSKSGQDKVQASFWFMTFASFLVSLKCM